MIDCNSGHREAEKERKVRQEQERQRERERKALQEQQRQQTLAAKAALNKRKIRYALRVYGEVTIGPSVSRLVT